MIISSLLVLATLFYIQLILKFRKTWAAMPTTAESTVPSGISIVVVFRNEEINLINLLNDINQLDRGSADIEVILIDDNSSDQSVEMVDKWRKEHNLMVRLETLNAVTSKSKKEGIELAISLAKHSQILLTDADCSLPKNWLKHMITNDELELKCGPVTFTPGDTIWEIILELELMSLSIMSACTINLHKPLLANGANLGYHKSLFNQIGGYKLKSVKQSASGDDIVMLRNVFRLKKGKISFVKNPKAIVHTTPPKTFSEFFHQRIRWAGKTKFDLFEPGSLISFQLMAQYSLLFAAPVIWLLSQNHMILMVWIGCFLLKYLVDLWFFRTVLEFFNRRILLKYVLAAEIFHLIYLVPIAILSMFVPYNWKGRKLKHG